MAFFKIKHMGIQKEYLLKVLIVNNLNNIVYNWIIEISLAAVLLLYNIRN